MDMDIHKVKEIIGDHKRFVNPFLEPSSYSIWTDTMEDVIDEKTIELYWQKLRYAQENADVLIQQAFQPDFYEFYGVNREKLCSPDDMCGQLIFESFVLEVKKNQIGACLSNSRFMSGHYIECCWNLDWELVYSGIC